MDTGASVEGSGTSQSIGLALTSRLKPRKGHHVPTPRMSGHLQTPPSTMQVRKGAGRGRHSPATVLGLQHLAVGGDTHLDRRLGWSLDEKCGRGWTGWCRLDDICPSGIRTIPTDGQPRLPWREYRTRVFSYGIIRKQDRYGGAPLLPQHRGTLFVNLSEERRHRNAPPLWTRPRRRNKGPHFVAYRIRCKDRLAL
jgi:hypothetical protein